MLAARRQSSISQPGLETNRDRDERGVLDSVWPFNSSREQRYPERDAYDPDGFKRVVAALAVSLDAEADVSQSTSAETQRLLGQLVASVSAIHQRLDDRTRESKESEERIKAEARQTEIRIKEELRNLKHEERNRQQVVSARLEVLEAQDRKRQISLDGLDNEVAKIRASLADLKGQVDLSVTDLKGQVSAARAPIESIISFQRRVAAVLVFVVSFAPVVWIVFGSTVTSAVQRVTFSLLGWK